MTPRRRIRADRAGGGGRSESPLSSRTETKQNEFRSPVNQSIDSYTVAVYPPGMTQLEQPNTGSVGRAASEVSSGGAAETRRVLLSAAESLFAARGYSGVGIREITDQAGVNISAIKYHFGSKQQLYVETVQHAMNRGRSGLAWQRLHADPADPASPTEAAIVLAQFIRGFLGGLLIKHQDENVNCLICNEIAQPSEAIDSVVELFIAPGQDAMIKVIRGIVPELSDHECILVARSVLGQILHYQMNRAFIDRMSPGETADPRRVDAIADHIIRFTLRALGMDSAVTDHVIAASAVSDSEPQTSGTTLS